ncbi:MAG: threonylcarbamoyl-AMP synthase [Myxococcales bacterium]|nr:MAG: threonylcarbamoyl-AMP synthase [Myxococcales bacterium]
MLITHDPAKAADFLRKGELVAFPTETVYGLGASIHDEAAVRAVYAAKGRPLNHPLIVHINGMQGLQRYFSKVSEHAQLLAKHFWPGPLTLVCSKSDEVPNIVTGGQKSVALRWPRHALAQHMLELLDHGVAAPSANRFGRISSTTAEHVREEFADAISCVLDGGPCAVGLESTIVDVRSEQPHILRAGSITQDMISELLKVSAEQKSESDIRVPGQLPSHYAPYTPLFVSESEHFKQTVDTIRVHYKNLVLLASSCPSSSKASDLFFKLPADPEVYAHQFYALLRKADNSKKDAIVIELPIKHGIGLAIRDRLSRAQHR